MTLIQSKDYPVFIGSDEPIEQQLNLNTYSTVVVLVDNNTKKFCLPRLYKMFPKLQDSRLIEVPGGESYKNLETCSLIWKSLFDYKIDRKGLIINLGGGVITDMGAFAASTFKRGIPFFQIPTTLLSMVDASVGGKTGIDFEGAKNILGTFTSPLGVWIHSEFLETLSDSEMYSGFSEMVKHGLIQDRSLFEKLITPFPQILQDKSALEALIIESIKIKNQIVLADPFEKGQRKLLNFGHTIGHALESQSFLGSHPLNHGQAIAMGMVCESYLSNKKHLLPTLELNEVLFALKKLFPHNTIREVDFDSIYSIMENDKKNISGNINFTFLESIGKGLIDQTASKEEIFESFKYFNSILDIS